MRTGGLEVGLGLDGAEAGLGDIHYARVGQLRGRVGLSHRDLHLCLHVGVGQPARVKLSLEGCKCESEKCSTKCDVGRRVGHVKLKLFI